MAYNTFKIIQFVSICAIDVDGMNSHGYYMVEFIYSKYNLQENKTIYGQVIESGELVENWR